MTATDPRTLDAILRATEPVDDAPFDLGIALSALELGQAFGEGPHIDRARDRIARYVNSLRVDTERARALAVTLEQECAEKDRREKEAADLLRDALVWLDDRHDNVRDYILEALSALGGER